MTCTKLQQSLGSSSAHGSNDGSRPDMTHVDEFDWDDPIFNDFSQRLEDDQIRPYRAHDAAHDGEITLLPSHSIFGGPCSYPSDEREEIIPSLDSTFSDDARLAFEKKIRGYTPMQPEHCDAHDTSPRTGHTHSAAKSPDQVDNLHDFVDRPEDDDPNFTSRLLRPQVRAKRGFTSTWMDQDDSGNYDPMAERKRMNAKQARSDPAGQKRCVSPMEDVRGIHESEPVESRIDEMDASGSDGASKSNKNFVVLTFKTEQGIDSFEKQLTGLATQRAAQRSQCKRQRQREGVTLQQYQSSGVRGAGPPVDLKNKPIARCCWACFDVSGEEAALLRDGSADCSLATDPAQWPCRACLEEDVECVLITEPVRKLACEDCKRQRVACSFTSTRNHSGPCQQCRSSDHQCVAGPFKDAVIPRLGYKAVLEGGFPVLNGNGEQVYTCNAAVRNRDGKKRRPAACVECSQSRKECSYENDGGACHECKRSGLACTIPPQSSPARLPGGPYPILSPPEVRDVVAQVPRCDAGDKRPGPNGIMRTITTSFSHPMAFNCDDEGPCEPCHFCVQPALRFVGFGRKETSVIDFGDSSGFVEVSGGHREHLIEPIRLCAECTASRLTIIMCEAHTLTRIADLKYKSEHQERLFDSLLDDDIKEGDIETFCSLCSDLATVECTAPQEEDENGCGLKLCDRCAMVLVVQHNGNMGAMLTHEESWSSEEEGAAVRADAELLRSDGVLMRHLMCLSRQ